MDGGVDIKVCKRCNLIHLHQTKRKKLFSIPAPSQAFYSILSNQVRLPLIGVEEQSFNRFFL